MKSERARESLTFQTKMNELQEEMKCVKEKYKVELFELKNENELLHHELDHLRSHNVSKQPEINSNLIFFISSNVVSI